jgi:hypothetical protein
MCITLFLLKKIILKVCFTVYEQDIVSCPNIDVADISTHASQLVSFDRSCESLPVPAYWKQNEATEFLRWPESQ